MYIALENTALLAVAFWYHPLSIKLAWAVQRCQSLNAVQAVTQQHKREKCTAGAGLLQMLPGLNITDRVLSALQTSAVACANIAYRRHTINHFNFIKGLKGRLQIQLSITQSESTILTHITKTFIFLTHVRKKIHDTTQCVELDYRL